MVWLSAVYQQVPGSVTPVDQATSSLISYIVSFGAIGVFALLAGWLLLRGWRLVSPAELESIREKARDEGRADLLAERERIIGEKHAAEDQRDEAMTVARDNLVPLLANFTSATQALLPILQGQVSQRSSKTLRRGDQQWLARPRPRGSRTGAAVDRNGRPRREGGAAAVGGGGAPVRRAGKGTSAASGRPRRHGANVARRDPRPGHAGSGPGRAGQRAAPAAHHPPAPSGRG